MCVLVSAQPQPTPTSDKPISASLGVFVYPKNNQGMEQQKKDEMDCFSWAKQQTGIDPMAPAPPPQQAGQAQQASAPKGAGVKGAAGGAAAGAAIGAIAGDAGTGAAIGATAGAMKGRRTQKKAEKQAEAQAQQQAQR